MFGKKMLPIAPFGLLIDHFFVKRVAMAHTHYNDGQNRSRNCVQMLLKFGILELKSFTKVAQVGNWTIEYQSSIPVCLVFKLLLTESSSDSYLFTQHA